MIVDGPQEGSAECSPPNACIINAGRSFRETLQCWEVFARDLILRRCFKDGEELIEIGVLLQFNEFGCVAVDHEFNPR